LKESVRKKKVLIVEDDDAILNAISLILGFEGYDVSVLSHGMTIMNNEAEVPDLYILDKLLPYADGSDICRYLKSYEETKSIPVIIISATKCQSEALASGATSFIEKPLMMHSFLQGVADALQAKPGNRWFGL
jgi:DNA-binding response OmpR family regulator